MKTDAKKILNSAYRFSLMNLAFRYTELAELMSAQPVSVSGETFEGRIKRMNSLIRRYFEADENVDPADVEALRCENVKDMEELTALTDVFQTDEYVLNRIEYGFRTPENEIFSDTEMTDRIIGYFSRIPKEAQNESIIKVIEQLPFRLTKKRFLELLKERLGIYRGSELSVFKGRLEMLKTAAGVSSGPLFRLLDIPADHLLSAPGLDIKSEAEFEALTEALSASGELLNIRMDFASAIQDTLNSFEAVLISAAQKTGVFELEDHCRRIIIRILDIIENGNAEHPEEVYSEFAALEGWPEELAQEASEIYSQDFDEDSLKKLLILISSSPFTLLDRDEDQTELDDAEFKQLYKEFADVILKRLSEVNRTYARALMARMNAMIPPRFTSQEELENYILNALSGCTNEAEKAGVTEILEELMKEG